MKKSPHRTIRGAAKHTTCCAALLLTLAPPVALQAAAVAIPSGEVPAEVVTQIEALTQQLMQRTGVPGVAIAVMHHDRPVLIRGFGVRQRGRSEPVDAHTLFPLASLSKPITSTVLAGLVGDGRADWDDPRCPPSARVSPGPASNRLYGLGWGVNVSDQGAVQLSPALTPYPLSHVSGDTFRYQPPGPGQRSIGCASPTSTPKHWGCCSASEGSRGPAIAGSPPEASGGMPWPSAANFKTVCP